MGVYGTFLKAFLKGLEWPPELGMGVARPLAHAGARANASSEGMGLGLETWMLLYSPGRSAALFGWEKQRGAIK